MGFWRLFLELYFCAWASSQQALEFVDAARCSCSVEPTPYFRFFFTRLTIAAVPLGTEVAAAGLAFNIQWLRPCGVSFMIEFTVLDV